MTTEPGAGEAQWSGEMFTRQRLGIMESAAECFVFDMERLGRAGGPEPPCGPDGRFEQGVRLRLDGERDDVASMGLQQWREEVLDTIGAAVGHGLVSVEAHQRGSMGFVTVCGQSDDFRDCCSSVAYGRLDGDEETTAVRRWQTPQGQRRVQIVGAETNCWECGGEWSHVIYAAAASPLVQHHPELTDEQERIAAASVEFPFEDLYVTTMVAPAPGQVAAEVVEAIEAVRAGIDAQAAQMAARVAAGLEWPEDLEGPSSTQEALHGLEYALADSNVVPLATSRHSGGGLSRDWEDAKPHTPRRGEVACVICAPDTAEPSLTSWDYRLVVVYWNCDAQGCVTGAAEVAEIDASVSPDGSIETTLVSAEVELGMEPEGPDAGLGIG